jgi:hypothetical protein
VLKKVKKNEIDGATITEPEPIKVSLCDYSDDE